MDKTERKKLITEGILSILFSIAVIVISIQIFKALGIGIDDIEQFVKSFGYFGVFAVFILMALSVMSPLPDTPISLLAVISYGPILGSLICFLGSLTGAVLDFLLIRRLGRRFMSKHFPSVIQITNKYAKKFGFEAMVFFRIFPTVTFDIASYVPALTKVKFKMFFIASFIGLLAPSIAYGLVGAGIVAGDSGTLVITTVLGILVVVGVIFVTRLFMSHVDLNSLED